MAAILAIRPEGAFTRLVIALCTPGVPTARRRGFYLKLARHFSAVWAIGQRFH